MGGGCLSVRARGCDTQRFIKPISAGIVLLTALVAPQ
jgi:hypothetical protein